MTDEPHVTTTDSDEQGDDTFGPGTTVAAAPSAAASEIDDDDADDGDADALRDARLAPQNGTPGLRRSPPSARG